MKRIIIISLVFLSFLSSNSFAQKTTYDYPRRYGNTFNAGLGMGYFNYIGHSVPVIMVNYEFDVARNFTLAPFVGYYSYSDYTVYQGYEYYYHETIIPLGLKGSYYFDELFHAGPRWNFYAAASLGFNIHSQTWDDGYYGDRSVARESSPLYGDIHAGARYHFTHHTGMFLDLSSGVSTLGLSFRM